MNKKGGTTLNMKKFEPVKPSIASGSSLPFAESTGDGTISVEKMGKLYEVALPEAIRQENMTAEELNAEFIPHFTHEDKGFTHDQLLAALYWVFDVFDRANMTFFLTHSTAEAALKKRSLEGNKIEVGVRKLEWDSGARSLVDTYTQYESITTEDLGDEVRYIAPNGVSVVLKVYEDDPCISSPDTMVYENEHFKLPNPYSRFLEVYK